MNWKYNCFFLLTFLSFALMGADEEEIIFIQGDTKDFVQDKNSKKNFNIITKTKGEKFPIANNSNKLGRQLNRRVDVIYKNKIILDNNQGSIWTTIDLLKIDTSLNINLNKTKGLYWFNIYCNYSSFLTKWEIIIEDTTTNEIFDTISGNSFDFNKKILWNTNKIINPLHNYGYYIKVFNKKGYFDQTYKKPIYDNLEPSNFDIYGIDNKEINNIIISGGKVKYFGKSFPKDTLLFLDKYQIPIDDHGKFAEEKILSSGTHILNFKIKKNKEIFTYPVKIFIPENYNFAVGLMDFSSGHYKTTGNKEMLNNDYHYNSSIYNEGRIAFYSKNKYKNFFLTTQLDTKSQNISNLFSSLKERDNQEIFKNEVENKYYSTYGDSSNSYSDINTQGRIYLKLNWNKNSILWGNYNTGFTGTEFSNYNRSLYGAKINLNSNKITPFGENEKNLKVFISEPGSLFSHDSLLGTGSSLYYLKYTDIINGSEKVWIELKNPTTGTTIKNIYLKPKEDYDINYFQGRIILNKPLQTIINENSDNIITNGNPLGDISILNIDYEYLPLKIIDNNAILGVRSNYWLNNHIKIGGSFIKANNSVSDYIGKEIDFTYRKSHKTFIKAEISQSIGNNTNNKFFSNDGGITYNQLNDSNLLNNGNAYSIYGKFNFIDISKSFSKKLNSSFWYNQKEKGFINTDLSNNQKYNRYGTKLEYNYSKNLSLNLSYSLNKSLNFYSNKQNDLLLEESYSTLIEYKIKKFKVSGELKNSKEIDSFNNGSALLGAIKGEYLYNSNFNYYSIIQQTLNKTKNYSINNRFTLGSQLKITKKLDLNLENSWGSRGNSSLIGSNYSINDNYNIYMNYLVSNDNDLQGNSLTIGQKIKLYNNYSIYQENQFINDNSLGHGLIEGYGLDFNLSKKIRSGISFSQGNLKYDDFKTKRKTISLYTIYNDFDLTLKNKLEFRKEVNSSSNIYQWLSTNNLKYVLNYEWTFLSKINLSLTKDLKSNDNNGKFSEIMCGFAYRPIWNDSFNFISKCTYLYDLPSISQNNGYYDHLVNQKSYIYSFEEIYNLTKKIDIGSKFALKKSMLKEFREKGSWYKNDIQLYALKCTYHFIYKWDILSEYHWLISDLSNDKNEGCLISLEYHVNKNMKVGVGYNFTNFQDDLVIINNYKAKGYFFNIIAKF